MDNAYPNAGDDFDTTYSPAAPKEQQEEIQATKAVQAASYPIMADVADWFENQIKECDSISNIQLETLTVNGVVYDRKTSIEAQILAYQLLKGHLTDKYAEFKDFKRED